MPSEPIPTDEQKLNPAKKEPVTTEAPQKARSADTKITQQIESIATTDPERGEKGLLAILGEKVRPKRSEQPKSGVEVQQVETGRIKQPETEDTKNNDQSQEAKAETDKQSTSSEATNNPTPSEELFSSADKEQIREQFLHLAEALKRPEVSEKVKEILLEAEVSAVVAGVKPVASLQPPMEQRSFLFWKKIQD